jgi:hypothetical protein
LPTSPRSRLSVAFAAPFLKNYQARLHEQAEQFVDDLRQQSDDQID